eukprot:TRINITY_DN8673_c0_g1_i4.p1 TRINITY_DN8673_c0_g1~~TRINITY_DN8673_c0_g1_i4.p1  ORF type:complete len:184 (-),score=46.40 TRINITY_DN8673_c0_g1_i4:587-1138(-)
MGGDKGNESLEGEAPQAVIEEDEEAKGKSAKGDGDDDANATGDVDGEDDGDVDEEGKSKKKNKEKTFPPVTQIGAVRVLVREDGGRQVEQLAEVNEGADAGHVLIVVTEPHAGLVGVKNLSIRIDVERHGPHTRLSLRARFHLDTDAVDSAATFTLPSIEYVEDLQLKPYFAAYLARMAEYCS